MAYSFPVYRRGFVFKTNRIVAANEADDIAECIIKNAVTYNKAFERAAKRNGNASDFKVKVGERVMRNPTERFILNFPALDFELAEFSVAARVSLTVCIHSHRSKVWVRLSCSHLRHKPARKLSAAQVRLFFDLAEQNAQAVLPTLAKLYCKHVGPAIPLSASEGYNFRLRAFNSINASSSELYAKLRQGLELTAALDDDRYQPELRDYFGIALKSPQIDKTAIVAALKAQRIDIFGHGSDEGGALFALRADENLADFCGYGYDDAPCLEKHDVLSQTSTRDILNKYAQKF